MRCAIVGSTPDQVRVAGGVEIKDAPYIGIVFATLTEEQVSELESQGCEISEVGEVKLSVTPPTPIIAEPKYTPQNLNELVGIEELRGVTEPRLYGEGINVAIIDTGIRETHMLVDGRVVYSRNFTKDVMQDGFDHGSGICSILVSVAPQCKILNLKVLNDKGEGTEEEVVLAINECISLWDTQPGIAPSVINLSLGSIDDGDSNNSLRRACRAAVDSNIWLVSSAGNNGPGPGAMMSPACERYVIAVGSVKYVPEGKTFILSSFSSGGPTAEGLVKPDIVFFGEDIIVASSYSDSATFAKSGTSFSAPFLSGLFTLYHEGVVKKAVPSIPVTPEIAELAELAFRSLAPVHDLVDMVLPLVCIKPQNAPRGKDNEYGYGMVFGPLVLQAAKAGVATGISSMLSGVMMLMIMGVVMKKMIR